MLASIRTSRRSRAAFWSRTASRGASFRESASSGVRGRDGRGPSRGDVEGGAGGPGAEDDDGEVEWVPALGGGEQPCGLVVVEWFGDDDGRRYRLVVGVGAVGGQVGRVRVVEEDSAGGHVVVGSRQDVVEGVGGDESR